MNGFRRTDLAAELEVSDCRDIDERQERFGSIVVSTVEILSDAAAERFGKPRGKYITLDIGRIWLASDEELEQARSVLSDKLLLLARELCGRMPESVMVVGLGNRHITADALGDEVVSLISVTRHIKTHDKRLFSLLGGRDISAVAPGVLGQTGIESAEMILGICKQTKPSLVIAVDALCARSTGRLATTIQLGSTGIHPGSGVGNHRRAINRETLGIPVIALGVPTVVDSASLIFDALEEAGIEEADERLHAVLTNRRNFFVTPKETDTIVRELSRLLASALSRSFGIHE